MVYKDFQGIKLSALGLGCMRLPRNSEADADINVQLTSEMVDYAMAHGINYYDTAWGYHDGESERVIGSLLSRYPRDSFYLASKFPGYDLANFGKAEEIFAAQLEKCRVDYFDFYLFHNVCEMNIDAYLDEERYGTYSFLKRMRDEGKIRHLGCSFHGDLDVMERFMDRYGDVIEFCQLQVNWFDWKFQNAKAKVEMMKKRGVPVWIMEPLRGGRLVNLSEKESAPLRALRPEESVTAWAFRFLQTIPEVTMILSGMSNMEQLSQNIAIFERELPLSEKEWDTLLGVADGMISSAVLPCTACRYCTTHCPKHLDIPALIKLYDEHRFTGGGFIAPMAVGTLPEEKRPSACIGCRSCEKVCPQQIKISEVMKDFSERLKG